ncbi:VirB4 family type IV secretion/conjugal transfer ATPase [Novosphingobium profundi]|uniref:VirB4 family type IV secretion/conjugal transfer ATPase n=1 Tax=Novosphingobium TaxID=165696 RepID=UPI000572F7A2|nr:MULTISPECIES: VirB4 family type IV secretion/conjugal transfer ATPase [Novosphingobium]MBT0671658.1 VirB4 family type IV secretion/conjugal transfer ATPase [Novosphingobium profundi]GAM07487.1 type IV secretion system protein VirB4 [Novosphingobium sp. MBES04]
MTRFALKHKQVTLREEDDIKFIPYTRHVNDTVVALADGSLMRMYRVDGRPFETCDIADLNTWHNKLNIAWRTIGDDRVAVWTHLVRTATNPELDGEFQSAFARDLQASYSERLKEKVLYHNEFYVTIVVRPSNMAGDQLTRLFGKADASHAADDRALAIMADKCRDFESMLADTNPVPLSLYERNGVLFSQPMEVLHFIQTGDRIRIPLVHGRLGQAIYNSRIIFGREAAEIRLPDRSHFLGMFGVREYVANTRSGQFNSLLTLDFPYVLTQSFAPLVKSVAAERFQKKYKQMVSSDDAGVSQAEELLDGVDDLMSNRFVMGEHHLSIAVIDDDPKRLLERLSIARAAAADTGMVMAREDVALEAAFWAQLPGNFKMRARPAVINSRNFAAMSPFHTFPAGRKSGNHWGEAVTLLKTRAGSSFWFNFHRADIGHTLIIGPTGGGKTVLQNFLLAQLEKTGAKQIFFDKDRGAEIFVRACGGTYLALRNGEPTGFAPLKGLEPTHDNMAFLRQFIRVLVRRENQPLTVTQERTIDEGLDAVMRLPAPQRSMSALREMLGYADAEGIGARLERWCQGGALGWAFDGPADEVSMAVRFVGFDMTDFLENPEIRTPMMLYLFHRVDELLNGQRVVVDIDEFWKALQDEAFKSFAQDGLKTFRKRNAFMVFGTQSPADALRSSIAHSIIEQTATKILLPNSDAKRSDYCEGLGLTETEFRLIKEDLTPESRCFLIKQGHTSIVAKLDLNGMLDELSVLSGRAETLEVMEAAIAQAGTDPAAWLPLFYANERRS